jgi:hypothetical protein
MLFKTYILNNRKLVTQSKLVKMCKDKFGYKPKFILAHIAQIELDYPRRKGKRYE